MLGTLKLQLKLNCLALYWKIYQHQVSYSTGSFCWVFASVCGYSMSTKQTTHQNLCVLNFCPQIDTSKMCHFIRNFPFNCQNLLVWSAQLRFFLGGGCCFPLQIWVCFKILITWYEVIQKCFCQLFLWLLTNIGSNNHLI